MENYISEKAAEKLGSMKTFFKVIAYRFIPLCFSYPFFKIFGRLEVRGIKNIPKSGGILIASNHLSCIDPPLLGTVIPGGCVFMAKHKLFEIPILKYLINYYAFPINRQKPGPSAIKIALTKLSGGEIVVIFPEGSRNRGEMSLPPKNGIGMIAALSKKKIIPTLIEGTDRLLPPGKLIPRPAKLRVTFGDPLDLSQEDADYIEISSKIMKSIENIKK